MLGKKLQLRRASLIIVGVAPAGFFGETVGQQPDFCAPLDLQPQILPDRDWLHDKGQEKVMWLHVFGRVQPGVSIQQADATANSIFKHSLDQHYGATATPEARKEFQHQKLRTHEASGGASSSRQQFTEPIQDRRRGGASDSLCQPRELAAGARRSTATRDRATAMPRCR